VDSNTAEDSGDLMVLQSTYGNMILNSAHVSVLRSIIRELRVMLPGKYYWIVERHVKSHEALLIHVRSSAQKEA
jgi:hypothetical protein